MKRKLFILFVSLVGFYNAQQNNFSTFNARLNTDKEKVVESPKVIKADEAFFITFEMSIEPKSIEGLDHLEAVISRGNGEKHIFSVTTSDFLVNATDDAVRKGNKVTYPRVMNYRDFPDDGKGSFYSNTYNKYMTADYFLSKKATDYSNSESVNEYNLTGTVYGYKLITYVKEKDLNGEWQTVPKYGPPVTLTKTASVKIITSDKIKPMPKADHIGDVTDLLKIGE